MGHPETSTRLSTMKGTRGPNTHIGPSRVLRGYWNFAYFMANLGAALGLFLTHSLELQYYTPSAVQVEGAGWFQILTVTAPILGICMVPAALYPSRKPKRRVP